MYQHICLAPTQQPLHLPFFNLQANCFTPSVRLYPQVICSPLAILEAFFSWLSWDGVKTWPSSSPCVYLCYVCLSSCLSVFISCRRWRVPWSAPCTNNHHRLYFICIYRLKHAFFISLSSQHVGVVVAYSWLISYACCVKKKVSTMSTHLTGLQTRVLYTTVVCYHPSRIN